MSSINHERIACVADFLKAQPKKPQYDFSVEIPPMVDPDLTANYVGAVVSLDYGFWRIQEGKFEADFYTLNGQKVKGATFLWMKSKALLISKPSFFTAEHLQKLSPENFIDWLKDDAGIVPFKDEQLRLKLIVDYGQTLKKVGGSLHKRYLQNPSLENILTMMEQFEAYRDYPLFKKAHLLCKILQRINQWTVVESTAYPKIPPIDYHLMNMAWKLGLVSLSRRIQTKLEKYQPLKPKEELRFRCLCANAYLEMSRQSKIDAYNIDDVMWMESRKNCQTPPYNCCACLFQNFCNKGQTGFPVVSTYRY